jgi:hypothetical protein
MGNALKNAGGLDGLLNWNIGGGGALVVDESVLGAPGRAVFSLTGNGNGQMVAVSDPVVSSAGEPVEASAFWSTSGGDGFGAYVQWLNGASTPIGGLTSIPLTTAAPYGSGGPSRGLPLTFNYSYGRLTAPAGAAFKRIGVCTNMSGSGAYSAALLKPYLATAPGWNRPTVWDPGFHTNPDLQLPVWPSILPPFQAGQLPEPLGNMTSYSTDTNIGVTRDLYTELQYSFRGQMRLNAAQVDALDQFYLNNRGGFFVVRPDTQQLCVAFWMTDGAPKPVQNAGLWTITEVGLRLVVT